MEQVRFFGALAKSPKTVGAVAPTSCQTADLMASNITHPNKLPVLELGPGTGAITNAILRRGVQQKDIYAVEYNAKFCRELRTRLPNANIVEGNAFELDDALAHLGEQQFDCVVSGLPLLNFEPALRAQFLKGALKRIPVGRPLIQFSYGIKPPIDNDDPKYQGSIRNGSFNVKLAKSAMKNLAETGAEVTYISLSDYPLPIFDQDLIDDKGLPENVIKLARLFQAHDGAFIACPEYNSSITPLLKNVLDWVSVAKVDGNIQLKPYPGLVVALGSASPGALGGIRGLYHVRSVLMNVGAQIVTEQCAISNAASAFDDEGMPKDERQLNMLNNVCRSLLENVTVGRGRA
ncbi:Quinone reductase [Nymphon striatum]|nr:Quinone reductase [Nymphon striatum]